MPRLGMKYHLQGRTFPARATVHSRHGDVSPRKTWFPAVFIRTTNAPAGVETGLLHLPMLLPGTTPKEVK